MATVTGFAAEISLREFRRATDQLEQAVETRRQHAQRGSGYDVVFRRDPLRPLVDAQGEMVSTVGLHDGLSVQGIIWSETHPLAVIEGDIFKEGETVGSYTILKIQSNGVLVNRQGETLFVPLDHGVDTPQAHRIEDSAAKAPAAASSAPPAAAATSAAASASPSASPHQ